MTNAIQGYKTIVYAREESEHGEANSYKKIIELQSCTLNANVEYADKTPHKNDGFRQRTHDAKDWSANLGYVYIADEDSHDLFYDAIVNKKYLFFKTALDDGYNLPGNKRRVWRGLVLVKNWKEVAPNTGIAYNEVVLVGTGPPNYGKETQEQFESGQDCFCIPQVYGKWMVHGDTWETPNAPDDSTGWQLRIVHLTNTSGTGNVGNFTLNNPYVEFQNCPVFVTLIYECYSSAYVPSGSGTAKDDFIEIGENSDSPQDLYLLDLIQGIVGKYVEKGDTWSDIYDDFDTYLTANPDYILDMSSLEMTDLYLVNTLSSLKKLNVSDNYLDYDAFVELDNPALTYLDASHNIVGATNKCFRGIVATVEYLDLSFNFLHEYYLFYADPGVPTGLEIDFYNLDNNFLVQGGNTAADGIKELRIRNQIYPEDSFWPGETGQNEVIRPAHLGPFDTSITEKIYISNTRMRYGYNNGSNDAGITELKNALISAGFSSDEADAIVINDPDYFDFGPDRYYNEDDQLNLNK